MKVNRNKIDDYCDALKECIDDVNTDDLEQEVEAIESAVDCAESLLRYVKNLQKISQKKWHRLEDHPQT